MRALEEGGLACRGAHRQHRLEQQRRPAIAEIVDQRRLEPRRILIEQRLHIGLRHGGQRLGAEPHQPQAGAVAVIGIGGRSALRNAAIAASRSPSCFADFAEREPGRGEVRRQFRRLQQQIGGGGQIALQLQVARKIVTGGRQSDRRRTGTGARASVLYGIGLKIGVSTRLYNRDASARHPDAVPPACAASPAASISTRCGRSSAP